MNKTMNKHIRLIGIKIWADAHHAAANAMGIADLCVPASVLELVMMIVQEAAPEAAIRRAPQDAEGMSAALRAPPCAARRVQTVAKKIVQPVVIQHANWGAEGRARETAGGTTRRKYLLYKDIRRN
jgi:hypothetical protein